MFLLSSTSVDAGGYLSLLAQSVAEHASQRMLNFTKKHLKTHHTLFTF